MADKMLPMRTVFKILVIRILQLHATSGASFLKTISEPMTITAIETSIPAEPLNPSEFEASKLIESEQRQRNTGFYDSEVLFAKSFRREQEREREDTQTRNGLVDDRKRWPKVGETVQIPYIISSKFTSKQRQLIAKAFDNFHETTCIRFVPRSTQNDYIHIIHGNGCDSDAGRIGGEQTLSLGDGCEYTDIAIHELNHAVGFWHEQNRPDRDNYVNVYLGNVKPENRFNFDKMNHRQVNAFGVDYDTDSIMHYDKYAFSREPGKLVVLEPKSKNENMGLAKVLSKSDVLRINKMYKCEGVRKRHRAFQLDEDSNESVEPPIDFRQSDNCKDFHENCDVFKLLTTCSENAWFKVTCREACNICSNPCQDMKRECPAWASKGACDSHAEYMSIYCPKSCEVCEPQS